MMAGFQEISKFGKAGSPNSGKSDSSESAGASPLCPQCGSKKLWRDGLGTLRSGTESSGGFAVTADSGFRILMMFRGR